MINADSAVIADNALAAAGSAVEKTRPSSSETLLINPFA
jgi:hypothetical protein